MADTTGPRDARNGAPTVMLVSGPTALNDSYTTNANTARTVNAATGVLANDVGTSLVKNALVSAPSKGTVTLNADGSFIFTPNAGFSGVDTFVYNAKDSSAQVSNNATVTVTVNPVAVSDSYSVNEDATLTTSAGTGLLANDVGTSLTKNSVTIGPANGTLALNANGSFSYTPNANFSGSDSFSYTAMDAYGLVSNTATVTVNVSAVNDAPVAVADTLSATEDTAVTFTAAQLLGNDSDVDAGDTLTIASVTAGTGGSVTLNGDGTVSFNRDAEFKGNASFTYTATDGGLPSNSATVTIDSTAPVATLTTASFPSAATGSATVSSSEAGMAYLVNSNVTVSGLASITGAADSHWNSVGLTAANTDTALATTGLADGTYRLYTVDAAGNLSAMAAGTVTIPGNQNLRGTNGADSLTGASGNDSLAGLNGNDSLGGGAGNDVLNGGAGADSMTGGDGADRYHVDNPGDQVIEAEADASTGGIDTVLSTLAAYTLGANVENGNITSAGPAALAGNSLANTLVGGVGNDTLQGGEGPDNLFGGAGNDSIEGGADNDRLTGGPGADSLVGGAGNDTYSIDDAGDVAQETGADASADGLDTVLTSLASYTLPSNIENLRGSHESGTSLSGNGLNNVITGGAGDDTITGHAGNDRLTGSAGADSMTGGAGNDTYVVDDAGDIVLETEADAVAGGFDTVVTSLPAYTLTANVEALRSTDVDGASLTGNSLINFITGGVGDDTITGGAGNDKLTGGQGADVYAYGSGSGKDTIIGFSPVEGDRILVIVDTINGLYLGSGADLLARTTNTATGAIVNLGGGNTIKLTGVLLQDLDAADFMIGTF